MAKITAGHLIAKALKNEGVDTVFSLCGGHVMPIYYGCREEGIRVVGVRHEAAAAHAADAYARSTGKPGVVITTAGPGVTNSVTAMIEAQKTGSPIINIGGASPTRDLHTGTLQEVDSVGVMAACSKWSERCVQGVRAAEFVAIAFREAMAGTPGPVYLEIGSDTVQEEFEESDAIIPKKYRPMNPPYGDPELIKEAAELLKNAKRPVLVVGDEARYSAEDDGAVKELVELLTMPVWTVNVARGLFADEDYELFKLGFGNTEVADVVLELCARNDFMIGKAMYPTYAKDAKFIQVNVDAARIGYNAPADVGIIGGAGNVAKQLLAELKEQDIPKKEAWLAEMKERNAKAMERYTNAAVSEINPMHPGRAAAEVAKFLATEGRDWSIVTDGGDVNHWIKNNILAHEPGQIMEKGPLGTIGSGAGYAIGAWFARKKPILYFTGDGSFGFHAMEFDTYAREGIPVVGIIANDSHWGMIRMAEQSRHPKEVAEGPIGLVLAEERRYDLMAQVWGGKGFLIRKPEEIIPAIKEIVESGMPGILNIIIDDKGISHVTEGFAQGLKKRD